MESPTVFTIAKGKVALIGPEFMAIYITQNEADQYLKKLTEEESATLQTTNGKIISYATIDEITSRKENTDIDISFTADGSYNIDTITQPTLDERDRCIKLMHQYLGSTFSYTVQPQKLFDVILLPGAGLLISAIGGGLLTWFCQAVQEPLQRTHIVKAWVYYAYYICKFIGPNIPMVLTIILSAICLYFLIRQSFNRPIVILIEKQKNRT